MVYNVDDFTVIVDGFEGLLVAVNIFHPMRVVNEVIGFLESVVASALLLADDELVGFVSNHVIIIIDK